jgi:hypothetical protein
VSSVKSKRSRRNAEEEREARASHLNRVSGRYGGPFPLSARRRGVHRMKNYEIKVNVEIAECDEAEDRDPKRASQGGFEMIIEEATATSIDECEKALLETNYEALRDALAKHLTAVSNRKNHNVLSRRGVSNSRAAVSCRWRSGTVFVPNP